MFNLPKQIRPATPGVFFCACQSPPACLVRQWNSQSLPGLWCSFGGSQTWIQLSSIYNSKFSLINIFHKSIIFMYSASLLDSCMLLYDMPVFSSNKQSTSTAMWCFLGLGYGHGRDTLGGSALAQNRGDGWRKRPNTGVKNFRQNPSKFTHRFLHQLWFPPIKMGLM